MSITWDSVSEEWIDDEAVGDTGTDWVFASGDSNIADYVVTDTGLIQSPGGDFGTFKNGTWTPYTGGDIDTFLSGSAAPTGLARTAAQKAGQYIKKLFSGEGSTADYGTAIAGLLGLYEQMNKDRSPKTWEGTVTKTPYTAPTITPQFNAAVQQRPYGERVMGMDPFSYTGGVPTAAPAPTKSIFAPRPPAPPPAATTAVSAPAITAEDILSMAVGTRAKDMQYDLNKDGKITSADALAFNRANRVTSAPATAAPAAAPASGVSSLLPIPQAQGTAMPIPQQITANDILEMAVKKRPIDMQYDLNKDQKITAADAMAFSRLPKVESPLLGTNPGGVMNPVKTAAEGGLMGMARGGSLPPRYLRGQTDGMEDKIPSNIDGVQPAKLSHGEFVIPADVVSHLGNGNSDAGAKQLYKMMDRVRMARTGTKKQGKQINPEKFTPGGIAGYAGGGAVAFQTGGSTAVNATGSGGTLTGGLSPYIGDYVAGPSGYLSKAWGLSEKPYEAYQGPLTAGLSPLQQQALGDYGNLQVPGAMGEATQTAGDVAGKFGSMSYSPVGETFGAQQAQQYMNPYLQAALDPQLRELTRQSDITRSADAARLAQAGAFGGSRQAIMEAEGRRNLLGKQSDVLGQGYATAYDKAMAQFNADQARKIGEAQYGADYGMKALEGQLGAAKTQSGLAQAEFGTGLEGLSAQMKAGDVQRGVEKENVAAQLAQWQEAQKYPYEQLKFQQSMIQGLPVSTSTTTPTTSMFSDLLGGVGGLLGLYERLNKVGG